MNQLAMFDFLYVGERLEELLSDFSLYEVQQLCYMSCLLSSYKGEPVSEWGYSFIKNNIGKPYSKELDEAQDFFSNKGIIRSEGEYIKLTQKGVETLTRFKKLNMYKARTSFLSVACRSIIFASYGYVKEALNNEPVSLFAEGVTGKVLLTDEANPGMKIMHKQFAMLRKALNTNSDNLLLPAMTWLDYMNKNNITK